jgi:hypothetical protein
MCSKRDLTEEIFGIIYYIVIEKEVQLDSEREIKFIIEINHE